MDAVIEIKARLPIEELVGQYCQIQKKGRSFVCLCPFHNDTHPSMNVSPDKGIAYCFACQTGGDIFSFYQAIEGVDFRQSLKDLAEKAGVELPREQQFVKGPSKDEKTRIRECLAEAQAFYASKLKENEKATAYLTERKTLPEFIQKFSIGYAPDSFDATYTHLLKKGFSRSEILKAGLGIQKELKEERIYDRFRNRLIFPIFDHQGNVIGFGGRTLGDDDAKYINSPDGPLYNKSTALFGLNLAKEAIRKEKTVILVEGYFDVMAFHRIGIENVVAVSGTALTEQHVMILKRTADTVCLALDADVAGEEAARKAFLLCKAQDLAIRTIRIPEGKDPDECARIAPDSMKQVCAEGGTPYLDAFLATLTEKKLEKRAMLEAITPLLNAIPSSVEREDSIAKAASTLGSTVTALTDDLQRERERAAKRQEEQTRSIASPFDSVDLLIGLLLTYPENLSCIERLLVPDNETQRTICESLKEKPSVDDLPESCRERASILMLYAEEQFGTWSKEKAELEIQKLLSSVNRKSLATKQKELITKLREAKAEGKTVEEEKLITQYQQVLKLASMTK